MKKNIARKSTERLRKETEKYSSRVGARDNYYNAAGQKVDGVTTILGIHDKPALVYWSWDLGIKGIDYRKYTDEVKEVGTLVHDMIRATFAGKTYEHLFVNYRAWEVKRAKESYRKFEAWRAGHKIKVIKTEYKVISEEFQYGGRFDLLAEIDGILTLDDWKTGKRCYKEHAFQCAAYAKALEEQDGIKIDRLMVINVPRGKADKFDEVVIQDRETIDLNFDVFRGLLIAHKAEKRLGVRWD